MINFALLSVSKFYGTFDRVGWFEVSGDLNGVFFWLGEIPLGNPLIKGDILISMIISLSIFCGP